MEPSLSLQALMKYLRERWSSLPDKRKPSHNQQYTIADGILSAFAVFFMQSPSFLAHQRLLQRKTGRNNARSLFQVTEIPSDAQIRNLVDPLANTDFACDYWRVLDELKRQQQLLCFRNDLLRTDSASFTFSRQCIAYIIPV